MNRMWLTIVLAVLIVCAPSRFARAQDAMQFEMSEPAKQATPTATESAQQAEAAAPAAEPAVQGKVIGMLGIIAKDNVPMAVPDKRGIMSVVRCPQGTYVTVTERRGDWVGILLLNGSTGWLKRDQIYVTEYQVVQPNQAGQSGQLNQAGRPAGANSYVSPSAEQVLQLAASMQGLPYKYGGTGMGGADCSAFVQMVFARVGVRLPRTAAQQSNVGQRVEWSNLQPGDRLYFSMKGRKVDHCGIYAGGNMFIHCSSNRGGVTFDRIDLPKYSSKLVVARR